MFSFFLRGGTAKRAEVSTAPRDVAVLRLDNIGDAVLSTGLLMTLRRAWPRARITVFCTVAAASVFTLCPAVNAVFPLSHIRPLKRNAELAKDARKQFSKQFSGRFEVLINPRHGPDAAGASFYVEESFAAVRIGFRQQHFIEGHDPNGAYTHLIDLPSLRESAATIPQHALTALNLGERVDLPILEPSRLSLRRAESVLGEGACVAIGLGAALPHKIWAPEHFAVVATALGQFNYNIVLLGAKEERPLADRFMRAVSGRVLDLVGGTNIEDMAAIVGACRLFVGNDSGPKHVAAAMGTPVVEVGWLGEQTPGFPYDHAFAAVGVPMVRLLPKGFSDRETFEGRAIQSIAPQAVLDACLSLLPARA